MYLLVFNLACAVLFIWSFSFTFTEGQIHKERVVYSEKVAMVN